jgi:cysteinyl-tRNA synthetase, unknown class
VKPPPDHGGSGTASRGFSEHEPWVSFYGAGRGVDLARLASEFRIINIDVDPDTGNFTEAEIAMLKADGKNRVLSYLNLGACESYRSYYADCEATGALTTRYVGYPDERWVDLSNQAYHDLIVNRVAPRLAERGIDGFYLDNLEVVEHGKDEANGPCDEACSQGGLDLVWELRQRFPEMLIVMQNASSNTTRRGETHGVRYASLLDGVAHEEVYSHGGDAVARSEMLSWRDEKLVVNGRAFWLAVEEYVGACSSEARASAESLHAKARADGFSAYVTDESAAQMRPCFWSDL